MQTVTNQSSALQMSQITVLQEMEKELFCVFGWQYVFGYC